MNNNNLSVNEVIILCGGKGTRLQSVVHDRPKPMANFHGKPFLDLLINALIAQGIKKVVLSIGYKADYIEKYVHLWQDKVELVLVTEQEPLGTGGALKKALPFVNKTPFWVINGDSYVKLDLLAMYQQHSQKKALMTMMLVKVKDTSRFGTVNISCCHEILAFVEKQALAVSGHVNAGVYLFDKAISSLLPSKTSFSLEYDVFPLLANNHSYGFVSDEKLYDIGTPESYNEAQKEILG